MNDYKISSLSLSFIIICLIDSNLLGIAFPYLIRKTHNSFLLSLGISFFLGFLIILIFLKMFSLMPEKNLSEKIEYIFPKFLGKSVNILIMILVFCMLIIVFWRFSTFVSSEYLTQTPAFIISLLLSSPLLYASFKYMDTAGRCASIIIFQVSVLFLFSRISLFTQIELDNFKPFIYNDYLNIFKSGLVLSVLQLAPLFLVLIVPKNNIVDKKNVNKAVIISYIISFIVIASMLITIVGTLGEKIASLYTFPAYVVLKNINVLNFIKNIENFSVLFWIMFMSFTSAICLLFIKESIYTTFKIKSMKVLNIFSIIVFSLFVGIIIFLLPFENYINKFKNFYAIIPFSVYSLFIFVIFLCLIVGSIKQKFSRQKNNCYE